MQNLFKISLLVFWVTLGVENAWAQEKRLLQGRVITEETEAFKINIINQTTQSGTVTLPDGRFKIEVNVGDKLLFSAIGYRDYPLQVTENLGLKDSLTIKMKPEINMLNTVYLSNKDLTGDLHKDAHMLHFFDQSKLGLAGTVPKDRTIAQRRFDLATKSMGGGIPVEAIINAISGRTKRLKKQLKNFKDEQLKDRALTLLGEDFYTKDLGLPAYKVQNFLYFCLDDEEFSRAYHRGKISLMTFMTNKVKAYKARLNQSETEFGL